VQIALDGTQAQVDFGADRIATRQIIEAGLPELASALRDAGFTLAGGGVSQHSRGQGRFDAEAGQGQGAGKRGSSDAPSSDVRRVGIRVPQGRVDLYA
jgi:flagellar hook-length control protein FliK